MIKKENKQVFTGVRAAARKCGCSPCHLSMILNEKRTPGKALARRLSRLGISFAPAARLHKEEVV